MHGLILAKRDQQVPERLCRNIKGANRWRERDENRMRRPPLVAEVQFPLPPVEQFERARCASDLVSQIVRPSAVSVDVVESADAAVAAATRMRCGSFRSGGWRASACSVRPARPSTPPAAACAKFRVRKAAAWLRTGAAHLVAGRRVLLARGKSLAGVFASCLRNYGNFHFAVTVFHVFKHGRQFAQWNFSVDEVMSADFTARNGR